MSDKIGPWDFAKSTKYPAKRKGGPLFTADIGDLESLARKRKRAEVAALPDPPKAKGKP